MDTAERLAEADDLWQRVYDRIDSMLADMGSLRPSLDEADEMTPEQVLAAHEKADAEELNALRECVHDVVRDAIVAITGWTCSATLNKENRYLRLCDSLDELCRKATP